MFFHRIAFWLIILSSLVFAKTAFANSTTIVAPNGGECITAGSTYTISFSWSGADVGHIALYYRTDGAQPTHLDSSVIKHPINVPQQGTTWGWKTTSAHISETGRIWIDGHEAGHISLSTWDSSNSNFAVRSNCAVAVAGAPAAVVSVARSTPDRPSGFDTPAKFTEVIPNISSARLRFESPWQKGEYRVRLLEEGDIEPRILATKDIFLKPGDIVEFSEKDLQPNTLYERKRFLQVYDFTTGYESVFSEPILPYWTLLEEPQKLEALNLTATSVILKIIEPKAVPNLSEARTQIFFQNLTAVEEEIEGSALAGKTATTSGWISNSVWTATGLEPDTKYQFWAKFRNGAGIETAFGGLINIKTPPLPAAKPIPIVQPEVAGISVPVEKKAEETLTPEQEKYVKIQLEIIQNRIAFLEQTLRRLIEERKKEKLAQLVLPIEEKKLERIEETKPLATTTIETAIIPRKPRVLTVIIENGLFIPQVFEINAGDTVRWLSKSDQPFWPASDPHPTHTGIPSFDSLGDILRGESYRYKFRKVGSFPYHNHTQAKADEEAASGIIIVNP